MKRKALLLLLAGMLTAAATASTMAAHRAVRWHRHHVLYPRSTAAVFLAARPHLPRNWGEVDFNVEPQNSRVIVDGVLLGKADDLNGWPAKAHLPAGPHTVRIVSPRGEVHQTRIYVQPGKELNFDYRF